MRNPGTHQVEINTASTPPNPASDNHGPGGPNRKYGRAFLSWKRRNARCVSNVISHANNAPNELSPIMKTKSESLKYSDNTSAATIPPAEASTATAGMFFPLNRPSAAGRYPPRASEKASRAAKYKLATALESAAVSTTKFMM